VVKLHAWHNALRPAVRVRTICRQRVTVRPRGKAVRHATGGESRRAQRGCVGVTAASVRA